MGWGVGWAYVLGLRVGSRGSGSGWGSRLGLGLVVGGQGLVTFTHASRYEQVKGAVLLGLVHTLRTRLFRAHAHTEGAEPDQHHVRSLARWAQAVACLARSSAVFAGASLKRRVYQRTELRCRFIDRAQEYQ
eukprot:scaffold46675_cov47-Phaeocystis_antarctica.AAC.1